MTSLYLTPTLEAAGDDDLEAVFPLPRVDELPPEPLRWMLEGLPGADTPRRSWSSSSRLEGGIC